MPQSLYSYDEVKRILLLSEHHGGHAGAQHVGLSDAQLLKRAEERRLHDRHHYRQRLSGATKSLPKQVRDREKHGPETFTTFLSFDDQITTLMELLNDKVSKDFRDDFAALAAGSLDKAELQRAELPKPVSMRFVSGPHVRIAPFGYATLVVRKRAGDGAMHVITFFGTMVWA